MALPLVTRSGGRDERRDQPAVLIYGSNRLEDIAFEGELRAMAAEPDLRVVHVLADLLIPPEALRT